MIQNYYTLFIIYKPVQNLSNLFINIYLLLSMKTDQNLHQNINQNDQIKWKANILTESTNAKIRIVEYVRQQQNKLNEVYLIKLIHLDGEWPLSPLSLQRKNYQKQRQFIILNKQCLPTYKFLEKTINFTLCLLQKKYHLCVQKYHYLPNELFISNKGNRISFWLDESIFQQLGVIQKIVQAFMPFTWLRKKDDIQNNQVQYGSQSFVNLIEFMALKPMAKMLTLVDCSIFQSKQIQEELHSVTSLINYNYRYFFPPKTATKFLKSTCGIKICSTIKLQQKRSSLWSQDIFIKNILEIRPTLFLSKILSNPQGPLYLQKYIFSQRFYKQIQEIYYLGTIKNYFHKNSLRSNYKYVTYMIRYDRNYLNTECAKELIKQLKDQWVYKQSQQQYNTDSQDDSSQQQINTNKNQQFTNNQNKQIKKLYIKSQKLYQSQLQNQFTLANEKNSNPKQQNQQQNQVNKNKLDNQANLIKFKIEKFYQMCQLNNIQVCVSCSCTKIKISTKQNDLTQFLNMCKYGTDTYCVQCQNLSQNDKELLQRQRIIVQKQEQNQKNNQQKMGIKQISSQQQVLVNVKKQTKQQKDQKEQIQFKQKPLRISHYVGIWYQMINSIHHQSSVSISYQFFHDSLQLNLISGQLTSKIYQSNQFTSILQFYLNFSVCSLSKVKQSNQKEQFKIASICQNIEMLKQIKYQTILNNVMQYILKQSFKVNQKYSQLWLIPNIEKKLLIDKLSNYLNDKIQENKLKITSHYKQYKQLMTAQYKVTPVQLKQMIAKFQSQLKNNITQSTNEVLYDIKWLLLLLSEYIETKTLQIQKQQIKPQQVQSLAYFVNQIQFLFSICSIFIAGFNQPGQLKIVQQVQQLITDLIIILVQNQATLREQVDIKSIKLDMQVIQIVIQDIFDHIMTKKYDSLKQDAKKIVNKHLDKFKEVFDQKLKKLTLEKLFSFEQQIKQFQLCLLKKTVQSLQNKNMRIGNESSIEQTLLSSHIYLQRNFILTESNVLQNIEIKSFLNLISVTTNKLWKIQRLQIKPINADGQPIKMGLIYKIISDTLQKTQNLNLLINVFQSNNKILINLINYMISESYNIKGDQVEHVAKRIQLYLQRQRYYYIANATNDKYRKQTLQIFNFLFDNRKILLAINDIHYFQIHYHMLVQVILLNTLPLYNIELVYKTELKQIGKVLRNFYKQNDCSAIQDYYLKVIDYRHNQSKQKRKKQLSQQQAQPPKQETLTKQQLSKQ